MLLGLLRAEYQKNVTLYRFLFFYPQVDTAQNSTRVCTVVLTAIVLSAATGSSDFDTATLSPVRLPSSHPNVVVLRDRRRASAATFVLAREWASERFVSAQLKTKQKKRNQ